MERLEPRARRDAYGSRINREPSAAIANVVPWVSIVIAIILPTIVIASAMPLAPPLGYMLFLGWRLVRPGLLPVWAGMPLGLVDDLFSGQPFGFAILTWSITLLVIEALEMRIPWRSFWQDWFTAGIALSGYVVFGWLFSGAEPTIPGLVASLPQIVLAVLLFPVIARFVAALDRLRLRRWKRV